MIDPKDFQQQQELVRLVTAPGQEPPGAQQVLEGLAERLDEKGQEWLLNLIGGQERRRVEAELTTIAQTAKRLGSDAVAIVTEATKDAVRP